MRVPIVIVPVIVPGGTVPTYAYACTACDHRFDVQQAFTDDALTECPTCAGRLRKLFSAVGVVFKGSGFYRTDSRDEKRSSARSASSSSGTSGSNGSAGAGDKAGSGSSSSGGDSSSSTSSSSGSSSGSSSSGSTSSSGSSTSGSSGSGSSGSSSTAAAG
ncbi:FmdB family zinc ribbon protein [Actinotalea sp. C106]|uniref:FmdB family zinc ribbon protein n=1 Tax=Actinotalea sp. C106 TaxID=2908644 RepID=UPI0035AB9EAD